MNTVNRIKFVKWVFSLILFGLLTYIFFLQTIDFKKYELKAESQHGVKIPLLAERGKILDRQGRALAHNQLCASIRILPQYVRSCDSVANILAGYNLKTRSEIIDELERNSSLFWFKKYIDYETASKIKKELHRRRFDNSVIVGDDLKRIYPFRHCLGSVVGFVGEEQGLAGIEFAFDTILRGTPGWILLQKDATGNNYYWPSYPMLSPKNGCDVILTIDLDIQKVVYDALAKYVDSLQALRGSALVISVADGAVLAIADYPDFDPQNFRTYESNLWKSSVVSDEFEPGSVYKLIICATALQSKNKDQLFTQKYDVSKGYIEISGKKIKDVHNNGIINFSEIFTKSSNVGVSMLSQVLDPQDFFLMERAFGFGNATGIELPGEANGYFDRPQYLTQLRFANNAFGQGVRVTLLQLAMAYLAVAKNGLLLKPYIIKEIVNNGKTIYQGEQKIVRRVLEENTAIVIKDILAQVVTQGTGRAAQLDDCQVCGKTGTAQKIEPDGKYSAKKSIMTFIGFFPKDNPKYLIATLIDEPKISRFAGETTCPLFKEIATKLLRLEKHNPVTTGVVINY